MAAAVLDDGGFSPHAQSLFIVLAGLALLSAALARGTGLARASRSPLLVSLVALAVLSLASAAWTISDGAVVARTAFLTAGYAATFVAAAVLAGHGGIRPFAASIAALAALEAILGLGAMASHALPDAERIYGAWRPGGTFQYPPALAILQVGALAPLVWLLGVRAIPVAWAAAAAATLAGATLALAQDRLALGAGVLLVCALAAAPQASLRARRSVFGLAILLLAGGITARGLLAGDTSAVQPHTPRSAIELGTVVLVAGAGWILLRGLRVSRVRLASPVVLCATVVLLGAAGAMAVIAVDEPTTRGGATRGSSGSLLHGRGREWRAAVDTWLDRPLLGAGAGSFYTASLDHVGPRPTRYAHDLPLELAVELGVGGLILAVAIYFSTGILLVASRSVPDWWLLAPIVVLVPISNLVDWTWHLAGIGALWAAAAGAIHGTSVVARR